MVARLVKIHGTFFLVLDLAFYEMVDSKSESLKKILLGKCTYPYNNIQQDVQQGRYSWRLSCRR